jgi:hypothetical protein
MIRTTLCASSALLSLCLFSSDPHADTLDFNLSGEGSTYAFQLPSSPSGGNDPVGFEVANVIIAIDGGQNEFAAEIAFFSQTFAGGLEFVRDLPHFVGPQVYTNDQEGNPTFIPGVYALTNSQDDQPYTLSIADARPGAGAPVPEPTTWMLMLTGLIAMVAVTRKRAPA